MEQNVCIVWNQDPTPSLESIKKRCSLLAPEYKNLETIFFYTSDLQEIETWASSQESTFRVWFSTPSMPLLIRAALSITDNHILGVPKIEVNPGISETALLIYTEKGENNIHSIIKEESIEIEWIGLRRTDITEVFEFRDDLNKLLYATLSRAWGVEKLEEKGEYEKYRVFDPSESIPLCDLVYLTRDIPGITGFIHDEGFWKFY